MAGNHDTAHHHEVKGVINGKMIVSDVLHVCPQAREVFLKHLGTLCLSMPGSTTETIEFLAAMNDYHESILVAELNEVCKKAPSKAGHF